MIIIDILKYSLDFGFWHFIGCYVLLSIPISFLSTVIKLVCLKIKEIKGEKSDQK